VGESKRQRILRVLDALGAKQPDPPPEDKDDGVVVSVEAEPGSLRGPSSRVSDPLAVVDTIETDPEDVDNAAEPEPVLVVKPPSASDPELRIASSVKEPGVLTPDLEEPIDTTKPEPEPDPEPAAPAAPSDPASMRQRNLAVLDASIVKPGVPEPSREAGGTIDAAAAKDPAAEDPAAVEAAPSKAPTDAEFAFVRSEKRKGTPSAPAEQTADRDDTPIPVDRAPVPMRQAMAVREAMAAREAAAIPHIEVSQVTSRGNDPRLILHNEPDSPRAASFRVLRHRIAGTARVIAVSSALPGEGKSTCAVNLGIALSELEPTVLLEANTENPSIAKMIGFTPPMCATKGYTNVVEALWPNLHILAVDPRSGHGRHIDGDLLRTALEDLQRAGYHYIVIDTPPILGHADVNLIQEVADGVIISAIAGQSNAATIQQAIDQLTPEKLLGAVLLE
jgi:Mrp family chromosome partitioning ATPase